MQYQVPEPYGRFAAAIEYFADYLLLLHISAQRVLSGKLLNNFITVKD